MVLYVAVDGPTDLNLHKYWNQIKQLFGLGLLLSCMRICRTYYIEASNVCMLHRSLELLASALLCCVLRGLLQAAREVSPRYLLLCMCLMSAACCRHEALQVSQYDRWMEQEVDSGSNEEIEAAKRAISGGRGHG